MESSAPRVVHRQPGRLSAGKAAYLAYLDVLEPQPRVYSDEGPGVWSSARSTTPIWRPRRPGERDRAEGVFR